ncbi:hypothetical protein [Candidatus Arthromitus sp. SFB-rat-Yit]|uniref:hypothetical protein n=1 Tax=Candidatus Arthromitus sp. SFB-rat-Yit TaxID=1041504 RepID=UPI000227A505|nr:hypothetical protein [Candidatus Arthromitus sp. SFB-rat-Yit]BAK81590.1 hypothetical protein RATSFB_1028 [Candidatus Arthromitus sp. SFB-rat-Yit]
MNHNNNIKSIRINQLIFILISYIIGSILIRFTESYLNNLSFVRTFYIIFFIYLFQLLIQGIKFKNICLKLNNTNDKKTVLYKKYLFINFIVFMSFGLIILGLSLIGLFFSPIKYLIMVVMIIVLTFLYFMYNIRLFRLADIRFNKYKIEYIKNQIKVLWKLLLINLIFIIINVYLVNFAYYLGGIIFVFIVLLDFILTEINIGCLSIGL